MMSVPFPPAERGFSLVELLVAVSLMLIVMSAVFQALNPAHGSFRVEPETADLQQRLRVAADALSHDLRGAGSGLDQGTNPGPLTDFFAPVLPLRQGRRNADPAGSFKNSTITLLAIDAGAQQTTIAQPLSASSSTVVVNSDPGCPAGDPNCGFRPNTTIVAFDDTGAYDTYTVTRVDAAGLHLQHNMRDSTKTYAANTGRIAVATSRTYFLKSDPATDTFQLMRYDGDGAADAPVVDHVVGLSFQYFGDPEPPAIRRPLTDPVGPWTTYGPRPQASGDNCVFAGNGTPVPASALPVLGGGTILVALSAGTLTDGPWCPDGVNPNRFDADLLRVRRIAVTLRVESAAAALRGPAGPLFARAGTSTSAQRLVPDREIRFDVSPRNLNLGR
jgi:prepilin-type N-terminal cleavage/methylation domain-containing protein